MYIKSYIKDEFERCYYELDHVMCDITEEEFNWIPPGLANPIGATFIHILSAEDDIIQSIIQRRVAFWEEQQWHQKTGLRVPPAPDGGWEEARVLKLDIRPMREYEKVVRAATAAYLDRVTVKDLQKKVGFFGHVIPVSQALIILLNHIGMHCGDIAAIKGIQRTP